MQTFFEEFKERSDWITSIHDLLRKVERLVKRKPIENVYLRGQADYSWGLRPTIGRKLDYLGMKTKGYDQRREERLLHQFRRYARALPGGDVDERELLLLARHHGLPVRLLDWTSNPLVALYHACADPDSRNRRKPGAVWMILRCEHPRREDYYDVYDPNALPILKLRGVKIIYAPYVSPRILAQSGHFTTQDNPARDLQDYEPSRYKPTEFDFVKIQKWKIPAKKKADFIFQLQRCGINERALFPDLDGIARSIVRTEILRTRARGESRN
jgi:FRG domain